MTNEGGSRVVQRGHEAVAFPSQDHYENHDNQNYYRQVVYSQRRVVAAAAATVTTNHTATLGPPPCRCRCADVKAATARYYNYRKAAASVASGSHLESTYQICMTDPH